MTQRIGVLMIVGRAARHAGRVLASFILDVAAELRRPTVTTLVAVGGAIYVFGVMAALAAQLD